MKQQTLNRQEQHMWIAHLHGKQERSESTVHAYRYIISRHRA
jgi:hypothetical protein